MLLFSLILSTLFNRLVFGFFLDGALNDCLVSSFRLNSMPTTTNATRVDANGRDTNNQGVY